MYKPNATNGELDELVTGSAGNRLGSVGSDP